VLHVLLLLLLLLLLRGRPTAVTHPRKGKAACVWVRIAVTQSVCAAVAGPVISLLDKRIQAGILLLLLLLLLLLKVFLCQAVEGEAVDAPGVLPQGLLHHSTPAPEQPATKPRQRTGSWLFCTAAVASGAAAAAAGAGAEGVC
jgi:hypothetical protein